MKYIKWIVLLALFVMAAPASACEVKIAAGDKCLGSSREITAHGTAYDTVTLWVSEGTATLADTTLKLDKNGYAKTTLTDVADKPERVVVKLQEGKTVVQAYVTFEECSPPPPPPAPPVPPAPPAPPAPPEQPPVVPVVPEQPVVPAPLPPPPVVPPVPPVKLAIDKRAATNVVRAGDAVKFVIKVTVPSPVINLTVCDILPRNMTFVRAPGAKFKSGHACWTRPWANHTIYFVAVARVDSGARGKACNVATVGSDSNVIGAMDKACVTIKRDRPRRTPPVTG